MIRVIEGDCRDALATLPDESVHCVVTSPPYWGLRDYGTAQWEGGEAGCQHSVGGQVQDSKAPGAIMTGMRPGADASRCRKCGARRVDRQLGIEATPDEHVAAMVGVFREVRRVLRSDGTLWLNYGDCYNSGTTADRNPTATGKHGYWENPAVNKRVNANQSGLKPKDLVGMPWRIAFALQADGWWLRSDIIWHKPNPMPESVTDRPTSAHEHVFLLSKSARYFYDAEAVREAAVAADIGAMDGGAQRLPNGAKANDGRNFRHDKQRGHGRCHAGFNDRWDAMPKDEQQSFGRNLRNVWTIATAPFSEAHFATFPPALVEPCILAGTSERGCCPACGAPWARQSTTELVPTAKAARTFVVDGRDAGADRNDQGANRQKDGHKPGWRNEVTTTGWSPSCACGGDPVPATVLDPFGGAGTVGLVADRLQRDAILIELNPAYAAMARRRIAGETPLLTTVAS